MNGIIVPDKEIPVSKLTIKFNAPGSAEFQVLVEGVATAAQKFVAAGWLGSKEALAFIAINSTDSMESALVLDFGAPQSSEFTPALTGRVTRNQLYSAAGWLTWSAEIDFTANLQTMMVQQQQAMQRNQQILQGLRGGGRTH